MGILGLDISTKKIGYAIFDDFKIVKFGCICTKKDTTIYERAEMAISELENLLNKYQIDKIIIEESLLQFANSSSSANTIVKLTMINAIISFHLMKKKINIVHVNASTARKIVFGKSRNAAFKNVKRFVMYRLIKMYGKDFYKTLPRMKIKDKLADEAFDIADAIVLALYGCKL